MRDGKPGGITRGMNDGRVVVFVKLCRGKQHDIDGYLGTGQLHLQVFEHVAGAAGLHVSPRDYPPLEEM